MQEHIESPTVTQSVSNGVLVTNGSPWSVFLRSADPGGTTNKIAFYIESSDEYILRLQAATQNWVVRTNFVSGVVDSGENDYFIVSNGTTITVYRNTTTIGSFADSYGLDGSKNSVWRSSPAGSAPWDVDIPNAAIYNVALSSNQRASLTSAIDGGLSASKTITYTGSFLTYPIITITGPITGPVLTNVSTGEDLDFTGITIAGGDTYTIDCRFGYKTVKNAAGTNKIADLTAASDLATFHLGADPEVSGGANAFTLTGTGTDANTTVTITYNERFVGA